MALRAAEAEDSNELAAVPLSVPVAPAAAVDVGVVKVRVLSFKEISAKRSSFLTLNCSSNSVVPNAAGGENNFLYPLTISLADTFPSPSGSK